MTTIPLTDSQVIAKVLSHYVARGHDQDLKDFFVEETKLIIWNEKTRLASAVGWDKSR